MFSFEEKDKLIVDEKLALVSYFEWECDTATERDEYVRELSKHVKIDSYGRCQTNQKEIVENSNEHYEIMGKYKFVLVLEDSMCQEYIGKRLWQALHVGAVPVYFGADAVDIWMPNQPSLVHIKEFKNPKLLGDHLTMLHISKDRYATYLKYKPSYNDNYFTLIINKQLNAANLHARNQYCKTVFG